MTKQEKVQMINKALQRSETAIELKAEAVILSDGRIEYHKLAPNHRYMVKATFREMLGLMWGKDMRELHRLFGR